MRYFDDTLVGNKDKVDEISRFLKSQHKNIKFTVEFENKYVTSFLHVKVKRTNESIIASV